MNRDLLVKLSAVLKLLQRARRSNNVEDNRHFRIARQRGIVHPRIAKLRFDHNRISLVAKESGKGERGEGSGATMAGGDTALKVLQQAEPSEEWLAFLQA